MRHLDAERLAAFDHDAPSLDELAHLAACASCRAEREGFVMLAAAAARDATLHAPDSGARLTSWESLAPRLRSEGLLTSAPGAEITPLRTPAAVHPLGAARSAPTAVPARAPLRRRPWVATAMRIAAVVVGMAGSAAIGRMTAGPVASAEPVAAGDGNGAGNGAGGTAMTVAHAPGAFASVSDATAALARAQQEYERASLWLVSNDTTSHSSDVYRARLAALDQMMAASRAALRDAPQDPVLNHYFLAASTAREATLQQLSSALPVDKTIETY